MQWDSNPLQNFGVSRGHGPTCEGFLTAGEDDGSHVRVALHGLQGPCQLHHQSIAERIERLWPVQLDQPHVLHCPRLLYQQVPERSPCPPHQHCPVSHRLPGTGQTPGRTPATVTPCYLKATLMAAVTGSRRDGLGGAPSATLAREDEAP